MAAARGLVRPLFVTHAGDDRLFVVGQCGAISIVESAIVKPEPFLDIGTLISCCGEDGLLGLAFHPAYDASGRLFITYVERDDRDTILAEYRVDPADPDRVDPTSGRILLRLRKPFPFHWAGGIAFGPDGYLYMGTGDGGHGTAFDAGGDVFNNAQNRATLLGKILRLDVDHGSTATRAYGIPRGNPFVGRPGADEIWAYGLRNPWRWSIDSQTGDLWLGDVGANRWEEVDRAAGHDGHVGGRGANFGWRVVEGKVCFAPHDGCVAPRGAVPPVHVYGHGTFTTATRNCAVVGGYVYRGADQPVLAGRYFFADYCSGLIWSLPADARKGSKARLELDTLATISSFGMDARGELYVTDLGAGVVDRLTSG